MRIANEIRSYGAQGRSEMDLRKICARRAHSSRVCAAHLSVSPGSIDFFPMACSLQWQ